MEEQVDFDYAVIGMGVGGLTIGALLANAGYRVLIVEQHDRAGGYGQSFSVGGGSFCRSLHYLWDCGPDGVVTRMLERLGLAHELKFKKLQPSGFDRIVAPGVDYEIGVGFDRECEKLSKLFPEHAESLKRYYKTITNIHDQAKQLPLDYSWSTLVSHPLRYSYLFRFSGWTLEDLFNKLTLPPRLRLILAGQSGIFLTPPLRLSLLAHAGAVGSYNAGAYVPVRSFEHVFQTLVEFIAKQPGCQTCFSTDVQRIQVRNGRAVAIEATELGTIAVNNVIFNGDPRLTLDLIEKEHLPASFVSKLDYDYSMGNATAYLVLKDCDPRQWGICDANIFCYPSLDLNALYTEHHADKMVLDPFLCVNSPTVRAASRDLSPSDRHQLVLVAPANYRYFRRLRSQGRTAYCDAKNAYGRRMIESIENKLMPGLSNHIESKYVSSPLTLERVCRATRGNSYGMSLEPHQVSCGRFGHASPIPNLHYVGASASYPGFAAIVHFTCLLYEKLTADHLSSA